MTARRSSSQMSFAFLLSGIVAVSALAALQPAPDVTIESVSGHACTMTERYAPFFVRPEGPRGLCPLDGPCDDPEMRDAAIPNGLTPLKTVRVVFHVFCGNMGQNCTATLEQVEEQAAALNANYGPHRIQFVHEIQVHNDPRYRVLTGNEELDMKMTYAVSPESNLNIYITDAGGGSWGYFPWWPDATAPLGGIVLHNGHLTVGGVVSHEVGHNLGLWHAFHGVNEVAQCGPCYESPGALNRDNTGDRCSDTAATAVNFNCSTHAGTDVCTGQPWGQTNFRNFMDYTPATCYNEFTPQQAGRMHCWIESELSSWLVGATGCTGDLNENGVIDITDLAQVVSSYGTAGENLPEDLDDDGIVGVTDVALIVSLYGSACE